MAGSPLTFASFWAGGALSPFEAACLHSYTIRGFTVVVYSFSPLGNLPPGVTAADAREIDPTQAITRFRYKGKPTIAHYSDYFRYLMFAKTDAIWVDTDMLLVRPMDLPLPDTLLAYERPDSLCNAIMRLNRNDPHLQTLVHATEGFMDRELRWGDTGPRLQTQIYGQRGAGEAFSPERFFPLAHDEFWKALLPAHREECEQLCSHAWGVHLWNNIIERLGVWKEIAPPKGSYLWQRYAEDGSLGYFKQTYPEHIMQQMVENWLLRQNGRDLGIANVVRQAAPSIMRTMRHYFGDHLLRFLPAPQKADPAAGAR